MTQQMGVWEDMGWLRGSMIEVAGEGSDYLPELAETLRYYLAAPGLRRNIAEEGYRLLTRYDQQELQPAAAGYR